MEYFFNINTGKVEQRPVEQNFYPGTNVPIKSMAEIAANQNVVLPNQTSFDPRSLQSIFPTNVQKGITASSAAVPFGTPVDIVQGFTRNTPSDAGTNFQFFPSANEADETDVVEERKRSGGLAALLRFLSNFIPGVNFLRGLSESGFLPEESPEIRSMKNFYRENYGLTPTGQIASGIMQGYNPVYGGFLNTITGGKFGQPTQFGLAQAARDRIQKIANRKAPQTEASKAKIKQLQEFARADTISRARQAAPDVYKAAEDKGFIDSKTGGFKSAGTNEAFSNKTGRGRTGY